MHIPSTHKTPPLYLKNVVSFYKSMSTSVKPLIKVYFLDSVFVFLLRQSVSWSSMYRSIACFTAAEMLINCLSARFLTDYWINQHKSLRRAKISVEHLKKYLEHAKVLNITSPKIKAFKEEKEQFKCKECGDRFEGGSSCLCKSRRDQWHYTVWQSVEKGLQGRENWNKAFPRSEVNNMS